MSRKVTLKQADESQPWYADGLRFRCTQCGNCCSGSPGYVWLNHQDMINIAEYLRMPLDHFTQTYVRRVKNDYSLKERHNYDCVFLTRDEQGKSGCAIYPVRPVQCRTWPFWNQNLHAPYAWENAASRCPGMCDADAPKFDLKHIEECRNHPDSPE